MSIFNINARIAKITGNKEHTQDMKRPRLRKRELPLEDRDRFKSKLKVLKLAFTLKRLMSMGKKTRRDQLEVITELLIRAKKPRKQTRLASDTGLNYIKFQEMIALLMEKGYMEILMDEKVLKVRATPEGIRFCEHVIETYDRIAQSYLSRLISTRFSV